MAIRLIDTETLRMKMFVGASVPPYAILSHTWVDGEEVDFQEMTRHGAIPQAETDPVFRRTWGLHLLGPLLRRSCRCSCHCDCCSGAATDDAADNIRRKSGYKKILQTCRLAKESDIEWAWVDTCCIDKSSSAELSEAINSMFAWYANAVECYAFLSDLEPVVENLVEALGRCRWFTRGWTLQELIAPKNLQFYNRVWKNVGSKKKLKGALENITEIDGEALAGGVGCLDHWTVATRMCWASRRQTTRTEDVAYCLLGIFGIHMPLLYGEGDKAFRRLQEEILKRMDDPTIFCTFVPEDERRKVYRDVLAISPAYFRPRCSRLDQNHKEFYKPRATFTMTNKGLLVRNSALLPFSPPLVKEPFYVLEMDYWQNGDYEYGFLDHGAMLLRWVGPNRYIRLSRPVPVSHRIIAWQSCCKRMPKPVEDFYIVDSDSVRTPTPDDMVELVPASPLCQLSVIQPGPSRMWDVAEMRSFATGRRWATIELNAYVWCFRPGYKTLAKFHILFDWGASGSDDGVLVQLYSSDEWKVAASGSQGDGGKQDGKPQVWFYGRELRDGNRSNWLCLGNDFLKHREDGMAPLRVRVGVETRFTGFASRAIIKTEVEFLQKDGRYSSDFSERVKTRGYGMI